MINCHSNWRPNATISNLFKRAKILNKIRQFFNNRKFMEVETPIISQYTVTDVNLISFETNFIEPGITKGKTYYLTVSPEYHMKRLLAAGSGPIFQLCHSFRNKELGRYHNPEFTMLEWYHPYYDMDDLINEVDEFLQFILNCQNADKMSYQESFIYHLHIDPLLIDDNRLQEIALKFNLIQEKCCYDRDVILQLLFSIKIEPYLGNNKPIFIYHFPASQACLAKINIDNNLVADRFEVYFKGIELANGFNELTDANECYRRFLKNNLRRKELNLTTYPIDKYLLSAIEHGIPECSGVSIGVDRLIMLILESTSLSEVITFDIKRT